MRRAARAAESSIPPARTSSTGPGPVRRVNVGAKFALIVTAACLVILAIALTLVAERLRLEDVARGEAITRATADRLSTAVQSVFDNAFSIVNTTHDDLIALKDDGITDPRVYDSILKRMLANSDRFGGWLVWDGTDAPEGAAAGQRDPNGRLALYWHQNGMEMIRDAVPSEIVDSDLFRVPREQDHAYLLEPHMIESENGDPTLVTSFSRPLEHDGRTVGVLAVDLKLNAIADALSSIDLPKGAFLTVVSERGLVAMSSGGDWAGKPLAKVSPAFDRLLDTARAGDGTQLSSGVAPILRSWKAIRFSGLKNPWFVLMTVPEASFQQSATGDRLFFLAVAATSLLALMVVVVLAMRHVVTSPLRALTTMIGQLGNGLFDLAIPGLRRADEIGDVARAVERLQDSGLEIARLQEENGEREFQRTASRGAELGAISARFTVSIETVATSLADVATTVERCSDDLTRTIGNTVGRLGQASDLSATTRASMIEAAAATSALLTTIDAIGEQTRQGRRAAAKVERNAVSTDGSLAALAQTVGAIGTVATLIRDVAAQINLIALNATIEAARAGPAGRGFAIVAQEIKILAAQTAKATEDITAHIGAVRDASESAGLEVRGMTAAFDELRQISSTIASALDVQQDTTEAIRLMVGRAVEGAEGVDVTMADLVGEARHAQEGAALMHEQSDTLGGEIDTLNGAVARFMGFLRAA